MVLSVGKPLDAAGRPEALKAALMQFESSGEKHNASAYGDGVFIGAKVARSYVFSANRNGFLSHEIFIL